MHDVHPIPVTAIDAWLPQTQCTKCGYPSCIDYARAIHSREADINRCPPGYEVTILGLAALLGTEPKALEPSCGETTGWWTARVHEAECIGCTLCIDACPVDAIVGAAKQLHTVIENECTGCELCLAPCPMNCITLAPLSDNRPSGRWLGLADDKVRLARTRAAARHRRLTQKDKSTNDPIDPSDTERQTEIAASVVRRRQQRQRARIDGAS